MALPPELQQELAKISDLPQASAIAAEMTGHASLAAAKAQGDSVGMSNLFNSIMIAAEKLTDAERLARTYAKSLSVQGLVEEDKVHVLDWQTIFNSVAKADANSVATDNIDQAFRAAEGGVLIISEPYQCPPDMSPRDFAFTNYSATAHLMAKMDEMSDSFDDSFNDLYARDKNLNEIDRQMAGKDFENPRKPVVIMIGKPFEMESMMAEDPYPWNLRFMHRVGVSETAAQGQTPGHKPPRRSPAP